jgi:outer membrane protein OmpA-like peptidoglycan-associated protein
MYGARIRTGDGKVLVYSLTNEPIQGGLYNFDIDWHETKPAHTAWLDLHVIPLLRAKGSVALKGQASRTDTDERNLDLSNRRLADVLGYLRRRVTFAFEVRRIGAVGERAAAAAGAT